MARRPPVTVTVDAAPGDLAKSPAAALSTLLALVRADGAEPSEWLAKALEDDHPHGEEPLPIVLDAGDEVNALSTMLIGMMLQEVEDLLGDVASAVDTTELRSKVDGG